MQRSGGQARARWRRLLPRRRLGWLWVAVTVGTLLNALRLRHRLSGLTRLEPTADTPGTPGAPGTPDGDDSDEFLLVRLAGVDVDEATRRAAIAYAAAEDLDVVDLVPGDLPIDQATDLARAIDTTTYRSTPLAPGRGALHAVLVRRHVWEQSAEAETEADPVPDPVPDKPVPDIPATPQREVILPDRAAFVAVMERLKQHAARSTDLVVAPGVHTAGTTIGQRVDELEAIYHGALPLAVAIPAARSALLMAGLAISPGWGAAAITSFLLQPSLATAGNALASRRPQSPRRAIERLAEPFAMAKPALTRPQPPREEDPVETRRGAYSAELATGMQHFFEPPRTTCPWCEGTALVERVRTTDLFQFKPGEFVIDECPGCGVLFQNPRLSIDGLNFYYRDFYDGLGAGGMQFLFAQSAPFYRARVELARRHLSPTAWLDVGTGYGHFCLVAQGMLPETRFDGLDMGPGIEEGQRRGWIGHGYRGMFPDLATELEARYDVVSMLHYLEHTRDPRAELDAARKALRPGGHLLIEVPDPECRFAPLLGRYWVPWLQPQHQQFLPMSNLCSALEAQGFEIVETEHCPANPTIDLAGGVWMWASARAPAPRLPWRDDPTAAQQVKRWAVLGTMAPLALVGLVVDPVVRPFMTKSQRWSNAYRVLARRL